MGADFIEPDLVMTKDGFLVVRHEPMLSGTTNVSEILNLLKKTTKKSRWKAVTDWFVSDFTFSRNKTPANKTGSPKGHNNTTINMHSDF
jgi:glycerophosphoryl diester phosphodiesterase